MSELLHESTPLHVGYIYRPLPQSPRVLHILILIDHVTGQKPSNVPNTTESSISTSTNQVRGAHVIGELVSRNRLSSLRMLSSIRYLDLDLDQDMDLDLGQGQHRDQDQYQ